MALSFEDAQNMLADSLREQPAPDPAASKSTAPAPTGAIDMATAQKMLADDMSMETPDDQRQTAVQFRGGGVDTSPLPPPQGASAKPATPTVDAPTQLYPEETAAAKAGVLYDNPAPAGHALASFALNDTEKAKAYKMALSKKYGADVVVETGPATGKIEWLDPTTGRFSLADPPGSLKGKITGAAGGSIVAIPELAGNAIGAILGRTPTAIAVGGGFGAAAGELVRLYSGQALGINQDMTDSDAVTEAAKAGGISLGAGMGTNLLMRFGQFVKHAVRGDAVAFAKKFNDDLGVTMEDAAQVQADINQKLQAERLRLANAGENPDKLDRKFNLTLGEASGNKEQLSMEEVFKRSREYQAQFGAFNEERQGALRNFYDLISKPFERASVTPVEASRLLELRNKRALKSAEGRVTEHTARYEAAASNAITDVRTMPLRELGDVAEAVGSAEFGAFQGRAEELAKTINELAGNAPFVQNTNTAAVFNSLDEKARNIVIPGLERQARSSQMLPPKMESGTKTIEDINGSPIDVPTTTLGALYDGSTKWTFQQAWSTLSRLKQVVRDGSLTDIDKGALKKVIGSLETDMYDSSQNSPVGSTYREFADWYRTEKTRLNSGVVDQILNSDGKIASGDVFRKVFPEAGGRTGGGVQQTREFMDLIKNDPQAISAFRRTIADDWRQYSVVNGRVDLTRSQQWMRLHSDQLSLTFPGTSKEAKVALGRFGVTDPASMGDSLFTPAEVTQIRRANSFEEVLASREARAQNALKALNKDIGGTLADINSPAQVVNLVRSDPSGIMAGKVMRNMKGELDVTRGIQASYLQDMRARVLRPKIPGSDERQFSPVALHDFLYGKGDGSQLGQEQVIRQMFGPTYLEGLKTLEKAVSMASREAVAPNRSNTAMWQGKVVGLISRAYFGPLSREMTRVNAAKKIYGMAADSAISRAIMSPANLKDLMSVWEQDVTSRKAMTVLGQLGIGPADFDNE